MNDERNNLTKQDKTRFLQRGFTVVENAGHSLRLIKRDDARQAISIKWDDLPALRELITLALDDGPMVIGRPKRSVKAATPPTSPSDAAMRAAEGVVLVDREAAVRVVDDEAFGLRTIAEVHTSNGRKDWADDAHKAATILTEVANAIRALPAAIITRHLAAAPAKELDEATMEWALRELADGWVNAFEREGPHGFYQNARRVLNAVAATTSPETPVGDSTSDTEREACEEGQAATENTPDS